jgi:hypothetical protein
MNSSLQLLVTAIIVVGGGLIALRIDKKDRTPMSGEDPRQRDFDFPQSNDQIDSHRVAMSGTRF